MKRKQVWRYYCDFCRKAGCSAGHLKRHEASCTANPLRVCLAHGKLSLSGRAQRPMTELIGALDGSGADAEVAVLRDLADGCPICILAAIRQSHRQMSADEDGPGFGYPFSFRTELKAAWERYNTMQQEEDHYP